MVLFFKIRWERKKRRKTCKDDICKSIYGQLRCKTGLFQTRSCCSKRSRKKLNLACVLFYNQNAFTVISLLWTVTGVLRPGRAVRGVVLCVRVQWAELTFQSGVSFLSIRHSGIGCQRLNNAVASSAGVSTANTTEGERKTMKTT